MSSSQRWVNFQLESNFKNSEFLKRNKLMEKDSKPLEMAI